ncbi:MAG: acyltransferase [Bacteroidales bacterium]|nr:acyltransferase [Bacteroidales bacterium]
MLEEFNALALESFEFQRENCRVYREYLDLIGKGDFHPESIDEIPFFPIRLFKSQDIISSSREAALYFTSSATTGMTPSRHMIVDPTVYEQSFKTGFRRVYGESGTYNLLALLPSYLERKHSSLVYMAEGLIAETRQNGAEGGFFLYNHDELFSSIKRLADRKIILLGVSFALLDFAEYVKQQVPDPDERAAIFSDVIVIETGGMKGRGEELSREELHRRLRDGFVSARIDSEYGMCELLSQAYSIGNRPGNSLEKSEQKASGADEKGLRTLKASEKEEGVFFTPPWMRVLARDLMDPFRVKGVLEGGLNIIDLANIWSCCFIETEDRGRIFSIAEEKKSVHPVFTVDGRIQNSELRGCNMLIQ